MWCYVMQWYSHILTCDLRVLILFGVAVYLIKMPFVHCSNTSSKMGFTLIEYHQYGFDYSHFLGVWYVYRVQCECNISPAIKSLLFKLASQSKGYWECVNFSTKLNKLVFHRSLWFAIIDDGLIWAAVDIHAGLLSKRHHDLQQKKAFGDS